MHCFSQQSLHYLYVKLRLLYINKVGKYRRLSLPVAVYISNSADRYTMRNNELYQTYVIYTSCSCCYIIYSCVITHMICFCCCIINFATTVQYTHSLISELFAVQVVSVFCFEVGTY